MTTYEALPVTPGIITWARERAGFSLDAAQEKFKKIAQWEAGEMSPTYPQLENLADAFKVPTAVFFFPEPPDLPPLSESFRTLGSELFDEIPPRIRLLVRKAKTYQLSLEELFDGRNPSKRLITRDLHFDPETRVEDIAAAVREYLGITLEQQFSWPSNDGCDTALKHWRDALWNAGVYVFKDSFREKKFSGFCLYHDEFPIIYVNNTTAKTRQIFTQFHELGHLLFETSGVDTPDDSYVERMNSRNRRIETICNRLAACILVPEDVFDHAFADGEPTEARAEELANLFKVSREFIFRKFRDRGLISDDAYQAAAKRWADQTVPKKPGGNPYNTKIAYLGSEFINRAFSRYYQNQISESQLAEYLDTKPKHLGTLEQYVSG